MSISLRNAVRLGGSYEIGSRARERCSLRPLTNAFNDQTENIALKRQIQSTEWKLYCNSSSSASNPAENQGKATRFTRWWEVAGTDNIREILSEEDLKDALKNASNKLVLVHFYSPSCGACRPLHPKIHQIAKAHQEVIFLKVNQEVHKSLCKALAVPLVPFFQFYRGAQGRLCRFSCSLATIKKLKDALQKHGNEKCSLARELDDDALLKLDSHKETILNYPVRSSANLEYFNLLLMLLSKRNI